MEFVKACLRLVFFVVIVAGSFGAATAQNADSLLRELNKHLNEDTVKAKLYARTAYAYAYTQPALSKSLAQKGIELSDKLRYERGKAAGLVMLGLYSLATGENLQEGARYCIEAIRIYGKTNDTAAMGDAHFFFAGILYNQARFDSAAASYLKAAHAYEKASDRKGIAISLDNAGLAYSALSNYPEALKYYFGSLKIRERSKDTGGMATCMAYIAQIYGFLGDREQAIKYISQSIVMQEKAGSPTAKMITYQNAGAVYGNLNEYKSALTYFNKALQEAEASGITSELNSIRITAAEMQLKLGNYDQAEDLYKKCLRSDSTNNPVIQAFIHRGMGRIYVHRGAVREGIRALDRASAMFRESEMKDDYFETAHDLSVAYGKINDYKKALEFEVLYHGYNDSLHIRESALVHKQQYEYRLQESQDEITLLEKNNALDQTRAEKQRIVNLSLVVGLLLLSLIVVLMYRSGRREARSKQMIVDQAAKLQELNDFKNKIFSVLSHDLRGPIGSLSVSLSLFDQEFISEKEFKEMKPDLDQQLSAVTFLLENLLSWSKSHMAGGDMVKKEQADLHQLTTQSVHLMQSAAAQKNITIKDDTASPTYAWCDKSKVDIIVRNLISNAVKFTNPGGTIALSARAENGKVALSVADTGIGMTDEQVNALFSPQPGNTYGTAGEKGVGLGLLLSQEFAKTMGGDIVVKSKVGEGSTFTLLVPEKN